MYSLKKLDSDEWQTIWKNIDKQNILQSWQYGESKKNIEGWEPARYKIIDKNLELIGLVQILLKKIPLFGFIARINRGPIIINQYDEKNYIIKYRNSISAILKESKENFWIFMQIVPEIDASYANKIEFEKLGFKKLKTPAWSSYILPLDSDEDTLLMSLNGKWRNCLRKSWQYNMEILKVNINENDNLSLLLNDYDNLKKKNNFSGISNDLLDDLCLSRNEMWKADIFFAFENKEKINTKPIGTLVSITYGKSSIYLIGISNDLGRKLNANYSLLWKAIMNSKSYGCKSFDLGGLNSSTPKSIAHFKKGLNAKFYSLIGEYRKFIFPSFRNI